MPVPEPGSKKNFTYKKLKGNSFQNLLGFKKTKVFIKGIELSYNKPKIT
jgi:hypothetical protein